MSPSGLKSGLDPSKVPYIQTGIKSNWAKLQKIVYFTIKDFTKKFLLFKVLSFQCFYFSCENMAAKQDKEFKTAEIRYEGDVRI